ncbi:MAG: carbamoyltransferase HypF [Planctomycetota bacterium]
MADHPTELVARELLLGGYVQGRGIRPSISRLGGELGLAGFVTNTSDGVRVRIEGTEDQIAEFESELPNVMPEDVDARLICSTRVEVIGMQGFEITTAVHESGGEIPWVAVPPDRAICSECRCELLTFGDRRYRYALSSCTSCGPRYSLIDSLPFERALTAMAAFELCDACRHEYHSKDDRRFHAQAIACENCGPRVRLERDDICDIVPGDAAIRKAADIISSDGIVCVKGIGGFQLMCSALSANAVQRLRRLKERESKPFAVMACPGAIRWECVTLQEKSALTSPANPIVIVDAGALVKLADGVSCGLATVGLFLPSSPLHELILEAVGGPVVVTSANGDADPIEYLDSKLSVGLRGAVDGVLTHNRPIVRPIDDSVLRIISQNAVTLRPGRGLVPQMLCFETPYRILAVGGHQKVAPAISNGRQAVLAPHIGEMTSLESRLRFEEQIAALLRLYRMQPDVIVHDLHPDYFTTRWASDQACRTLAVQHHHAHVVSAMLEHGWTDRTVLGIAFDGTGFGPDGTIWGGEFLLATVTGFRRVAHWRTFSVLGGDAGVREPWRIAVSLLSAAMPELSGIDLAMLIENRRRPLQPEVSLENVRAVQRLQTSQTAMVSSSMGRLFDGVASLVCGVTAAHFEGEPAMQLESLVSQADCPDKACRRGYTVRVAGSDGSDSAVVLDWRPMIRELVTDLGNRVPQCEVSQRFHLAIAEACGLVAARFPEYPVVLSGGCFQNRVLTEAVERVLRDRDRPVGIPGFIPPNDGGLAVGQLVIGSATLSTIPADC